MCWEPLCSLWDRARGSLMGAGAQQVLQSLRCGAVGIGGWLPASRPVKSGCRVTADEPQPWEVKVHDLDLAGQDGT